MKKDGKYNMPNQMTLGRVEQLYNKILADSVEVFKKGTDEEFINQLSILQKDHPFLLNILNEKIKHENISEERKGFFLKQLKNPLIEKLIDETKN